MGLDVTDAGIRAAADEVVTVGERLRAIDVDAPLDRAAAGLPGAETARALGLLALQLREEVTRIAGGWETWGRAADASANAYEATDAGAARSFGPVPL